MRKRYTRKFRHWSPRWKWDARSWAEISGWEHDVRAGAIDDAIEDTLHPCLPARGPDLDDAVRYLIHDDPNFGLVLWQDANETIARLAERLYDFIPREEVWRLIVGDDDQD